MKTTKWILAFIGTTIAAALIMLLLAVQSSEPPARAQETRPRAPASQQTAADFVHPAEIAIVRRDGFTSIRGPDQPALGVPAWSEPLATMPTERPPEIEAAIARRARRP